MPGREGPSRRRALPPHLPHDFPYGGERVLTGLLPRQNYKFTGKERDTESGLDYFGARYYSSRMGRWLTPDWANGAEAVPYADFGDPQSLNLYGYVGNQPVTRFDADGHCPLCVVEEVVTEVVLTHPAEVTRALQGIELATAAGENAAPASLGLPILAGTAVVVTAYDAITTITDAYVEDKQDQQSLDAQSSRTGNDNHNKLNNTVGKEKKPKTNPATEPKEHKKDKRQSTKDKHEKRRPGTSPPPNYVPDRKFKQPKDDKKKDKKREPYFRKDRDNKPTPRMN